MKNMQEWRSYYKNIKLNQISFYKFLKKRVRTLSWPFTIVLTSHNGIIASQWNDVNDETYCKLVGVMRSVKIPSRLKKSIAPLQNSSFEWKNARCVGAMVREWRKHQLFLSHCVLDYWASKFTKLWQASHGDQ